MPAAPFDRPRVPRLIKPLGVMLVALASVAWFWRFQIADGFAHGFGDAYDAVIEIAILQHWANVFAGAEAWDATRYFYPAARTLGYNDGYLASGMLFALARAAGASLVGAAEITHAAYKLIGFFGMYRLLRGPGACPVGWGLFGAVLFTLADLTLQHANHGQLFTLALAPWAALLSWQTYTALLDGDRRRLRRDGLALVLLLAIWISTGFYLAWFFLFFTLLSLLAAFATVTPFARHRTVTQIANALPTLLLLGGVGLVLLLPFISVYAGKAGETGMHPYAVVAATTLHPIELINPGAANLFWSPIAVLVRARLAPGLPVDSDSVFGFAPLLLVFTVVATLGARRRRASDYAIGLATLIAVLLIIRVGGVSLWQGVHALVPGAAAIRVVGRFQLLLLVPAVWLVTRWLAANPSQGLAATLALLLLFEQTATRAPVVLPTRAPEALRAGVPPPPAACRVFAVQAARAAPVASADPANDALYGHNVDAMLLSEIWRRPTINGVSTFNPPGWDFAAPDRADYRRRVTRYARRFGLTGLCLLDRRAAAPWQRLPD